MAKVGIIGISGYTGAELLRLLAGHPFLSVHVVTGRSEAGKLVGDIFPSLVPYASLPILETDEALPQLSECDLVFLALPHGESQKVVPSLLKIAPLLKIIDLSNDFRLRSPEKYQEWYGKQHECPELLGRWIYGCPEIFTAELRQAQLVANPGCFAICLLLAAWPALHAGIVKGPLVAHGISGTSGAGKGVSSRLHFSHVFEDIHTYKVGSHQHVGEVEQNLENARGSYPVVLSTSIAPMSRGIQIILSAPLEAEVSELQLKELFTEAYAYSPFVQICPHSPNTKMARGSNMVFIYPSIEKRTQTLLVVAVIDNLVKGAAGTALQNANLLLGYEESVGLPMIGLYP